MACASPCLPTTSAKPPQSTRDPLPSWTPPACLAQDDRDEMLAIHPN